MGRSRSRFRANEFLSALNDVSLSIFLFFVTATGVAPSEYWKFVRIGAVYHKTSFSSDAAILCIRQICNTGYACCKRCAAVRAYTGSVFAVIAVVRVLVLGSDMAVIGIALVFFYFLAAGSFCVLVIRFYDSVALARGRCGHGLRGRFHPRIHQERQTSRHRRVFGCRGISPAGCAVTRGISRFFFTR